MQNISHLHDESNYTAVTCTIRLSRASCLAFPQLVTCSVDDLCAQWHVWVACAAQYGWVDTTSHTRAIPYDVAFATNTKLTETSCHATTAQIQGSAEE